MENRLVAVTSSDDPDEVTRFKYDTNGQRTMTIVEPAGDPEPDNQRTITYYPFPNYEQEKQQRYEAGGEGTDPWVTTATIKRSTYFLGGRAIATRVTTSPPDVNNDGLYFIHTDQLGSISLLTDDQGVLAPDTAARYYPFGDYRTTPTANLTDRGFTGHRQNNLGSNDIGLIYMGARFYVPSLGRFASADTLVPDPSNPQSFNRFSYVNNRSLNFTDPTGHCPGSPGDGVNDDCWNYLMGNGNDSFCYVSGVNICPNGWEAWFADLIYGTDAYGTYMHFITPWTKQELVTLAGAIHDMILAMANEFINWQDTPLADTSYKKGNDSFVSPLRPRVVTLSSVTEDRIWHETAHALDFGNGLARIYAWESGNCTWAGMGVTHTACSTTAAAGYYWSEYGYDAGATYGGVFGAFYRSHFNANDTFAEAFVAWVHRSKHGANPIPRYGSAPRVDPLWDDMYRAVVVALSVFKH